MEFDFEAGDLVRLLTDYPEYDLQAGDAGYIWGIYTADVIEGLTPPFYEASFYNKDGECRDMMFNTNDVERVNDPLSVRIPAEAHNFWQSLRNQ